MQKIVFRPAGFIIGWFHFLLLFLNLVWICQFDVSHAELLQFDFVFVGFDEFFYLWKWVFAIVDDAGDAGLNKRFRAAKAWLRRYVYGGTFCFGSSRLYDSVLFGMHAQALVEAVAASCVAVAPLATALVAILHTERRAIISSGQNSIIFDNYSANSALHTVGTS